MKLWTKIGTLLIIIIVSFSQNILYYDVRENNTDTTLLFSFAHLTDIHIGEGENDYGTTGFLDTLNSSSEGTPAIRFRQALNWINNNKNNLKIQFVIITGDLTDSGELSEFLKFKEIISNYNIPILPIIGNHDIWPYTRSVEATAPYGDSIFINLFQDIYNNFKAITDTFDNGTRLTRAWNQENNTYSYFQNFFFEYKNYRFIFFDGISRKHALFNQPGVGPDAYIYNFPGGSYHWLKNTLSKLPPMFTFFFSHYPLWDNILAAANSFSPAEYDSLTRIIYNYNPSSIWIAGHIHRNDNYPLTYKPNNTKFGQCVETEANKQVDGGAIRIFRIYANLSSVSKQYEKPVIKFINSNTLEVITNKPNSNVYVFDIYGRLITYYDFNIKTYIKLNNLSSGVYIVRANNFYKKIVKLY